MGLGVFATSTLLKGTFVGCYIGEIVQFDEVKDKDS